MSKFNFTFKTQAEYLSERLKGYIEQYNNVRVEIISSEGWCMDFPLHSEEEYNDYLTNHKKNGDRIVKTYANSDFYENKHWY